MNDNNSIKKFVGDNLPQINTVNWLCFFGLSITTLYTANTAALAKLRPIMGDYAYLAPVAALLIGFLILSFFDFDLRKNFITSLQAVNAEDWKTAGRGLKAVAIFFLFIAVIRLSLSTGATFISGAFMADDMVEDVDTDGLEKMAAEKEQTKQSIATTLSEQIQQVNEEAKAEARRIEENAINAGGARWAKLWRSNNGWIRTVSGPDYRHIEKWRNGIYQAQKKADQILADARQETKELRESSKTLIELETKDASFAAIARAKTKKIEKAEQREFLLQVGLWALDGLFSIMAILSSIGLVIGAKCRPEYRIFREEETTAFQVVREAVASAWRIVVSYGVALVAGLDAKAARVATSLSNGTGAVDLNARAVEMRRGAHTPATHATNGAHVASEPATHAPRHAPEKKAPAPEPAPDVPSARGGAVSDKRDTPSQVDVKYVDMKNHIDRIAKRYKRAWKANDTEKMRRIVADKKDGVAWLESLGFEVTCDEKTGRISVKKN